MKLDSFESSLHLYGGPGSAVQGLPEGHTEACYPIKSACIGSTTGPLTDQDAEKREVCLSTG